MGYTHYWNHYQSIPQDKWEKIAVDTMKVFDYCEENNIPLQFEHDVQEPPKVSDTLIRFNGVGGDGHETLFIEKERAIDSNDPFNFCKTARKPYDLAVGLVLLVMAKHASDEIKISSDGHWSSDWFEIRQAYQAIFDEEVHNCLEG
jgi:hypothetical protein